MVISVTFNKRLPPAAANAGRGTLAELMAKQKAAAEAQSTAAAQPSPTIMQGFGNMAQALSQGIREGRASSDLHAQEAAQAKLMGEIDPATGATNAQIAAAGQYDPELMKTLWADRAGKLREDAKRENWQPLLDTEKQRYGIAADDKTPYKINVTTGDVEPVSKGGNTTIDLGGKQQNKWEEQSGATMQDIIKSDVETGKLAAVQNSNYDALEQLSEKMLRGPDAKISQWVNQTFGVNLGEAATATQTFEAIINNMVPKERVPGSGSTSNWDAQTMKSSLPSYLQTKEGTALLLKHLRTVAAHNQAVAGIAQQAAMKGSAMESRQYYYDELNKLGNPVSGFKAEIDALNKKIQEGGGGGNPANPANPANPDQPVTIKEPNIDPQTGKIDSSNLTDEEWAAWKKSKGI